MTEYRNMQLPLFKLGINNLGLKSNQTLLQRNLNSFYEQNVINKPIIIPKKPEPNVFFTSIDNREQIMKMMKNDLELQLNFTKTYLSIDRR
jgi:hypothetical protein